MCDDAAVLWSNYEQNRRHIRDELQNETLRTLDNHLTRYKNLAVDSQFLAGFELAIDLVRTPRTAEMTEQNELDAPRLF